MGDFISDLLAAIEAREQKARAAMQARSWWNRKPLGGTWDDGGGTVLDSNGVALWDDAGSDTHHMPEAASAFIADNDPSSVLRRCKADRATVIQYELLSGRTDYVPGLGEALAVLRQVVERLAYAYSVSTDTNEELTVLGAPTGQGHGQEPGYYFGAGIVGMTTADKGAMAEIRDEAGFFVYDGAGWRGPFASTGEAMAFRRGLAEGKP